MWSWFSGSSADQGAATASVPQSATPLSAHDDLQDLFHDTMQGLDLKNTGATELEKDLRKVFDDPDKYIYFHRRLSELESSAALQPPQWGYNDDGNETDAGFQNDLHVQQILSEIYPEKYNIHTDIANLADSVNKAIENASPEERLQLVSEVESFRDSLPALFEERLSAIERKERLKDYLKLVPRPDLEGPELDAIWEMIPALEEFLVNTYPDAPPSHKALLESDLRDTGYLGFLFKKGNVPNDQLAQEMAEAFSIPVQQALSWIDPTFDPPPSSVLTEKQKRDMEHAERLKREGQHVYYYQTQPPPKSREDIYTQLQLEADYLDTRHLIPQVSSEFRGLIGDMTTLSQSITPPPSRLPQPQATMVTEKKPRRFLDYFNPFKSSSSREDTPSSSPGGELTPLEKATREYLAKEATIKPVKSALELDSVDHLRHAPSHDRGDNDRIRRIYEARHRYRQKNPLTVEEIERITKPMMKPEDVPLDQLKKAYPEYADHPHFLHLVKDLDPAFHPLYEPMISKENLFQEVVSTIVQTPPPDADAAEFKSYLTSVNQQNEFLEKIDYTMKTSPVAAKVIWDSDDEDPPELFVEDKFRLNAGFTDYEIREYFRYLNEDLTPEEYKARLDDFKPMLLEKLNAFRPPGTPVVVDINYGNPQDPLVFDPGKLTEASKFYAQFSTASPTFTKEQLDFTYQILAKREYEHFQQSIQRGNRKWRLPEVPASLNTIKLAVEPETLRAIQSTMMKDYNEFRELDASSDNDTDDHTTQSNRMADLLKPARVVLNELGMLYTSMFQEDLNELDAIDITSIKNNATTTPKPPSLVKSTAPTFSYTVKELLSLMRGGLHDHTIDGNDNDGDNRVKTPEEILRQKVRSYRQQSSQNYIELPIDQLAELRYALDDPESRYLPRYRRYTPRSPLIIPGILAIKEFPCEPPESLIDSMIKQGAPTQKKIFQYKKELLLFRSQIAEAGLHDMTLPELIATLKDKEEHPSMVSSVVRPIQFYLGFGTQTHNPMARYELYRDLPLSVVNSAGDTVPLTSSYCERMLRLQTFFDQSPVILENLYTFDPLLKRDPYEILDLNTMAYRAHKIIENLPPEHADDPLLRERHLQGMIDDAVNLSDVEAKSIIDSAKLFSAQDKHIFLDDLYYFFGLQPSNILLPSASGRISREDWSDEEYIAYQQQAFFTQFEKLLYDYPPPPITGDPVRDKDIALSRFQTVLEKTRTPTSTVWKRKVHAPTIDSLEVDTILPDVAQALGINLDEPVAFTPQFIRIPTTDPMGHTHMQYLELREDSNGNEVWIPVDMDLDGHPIASDDQVRSVVAYNRNGEIMNVGNIKLKSRSEQHYERLLYNPSGQLDLDAVKRFAESYQSNRIQNNEDSPVFVIEREEKTAEDIRNELLEQRRQIHYDEFRAAVAAHQAEALAQFDGPTPEEIEQARQDYFNRMEADILAVMQDTSEYQHISLRELENKYPQVKEYMDQVRQEEGITDLVDQLNQALVQPLSEREIEIMTDDKGQLISPLARPPGVSDGDYRTALNILIAKINSDAQLPPETVRHVILYETNRDFYRMYSPIVKQLTDQFMLFKERKILLDQYYAEQQQNPNSPGSKRSGKTPLDFLTAKSKM